MSLSVKDLKAESTSFRGHLFNALLVLVMKISFLTYFVLTPWLKRMSTDLSVSTEVMALVAVVYEAGKFVGCVVFGLLGDGGNTFLVMVKALSGFAVLSSLLYAFLGNGLRTHTSLDFVFFASLYFPLSVLCIAPQFGLAILKQTNSAARCKRYVMIQGLLACVLQGLSVPFGGAVGEAFGWKAEFAALACFGGAVSVGLYLVASSAHVDACQPKTKAPLLESGQAEPDTYWLKVFALLFTARYRSFQIFLAALGVATATMYMIPMYGMLLVQGEGDGLLSETDAAKVVGATFLGNLLARLASLAFADRMSSVGFVKLGAPFLFLGSLLAVVLDATGTQYTVPAKFVGTGFVIQIGVGFVMPNCKAGALLEVSDENVSAANSLVKLSQLIFTAMAQLLATFSGCTWSYSRFALLLLLWNTLMILGLGWWSCTSHV